MNDFINDVVIPIAVISAVIFTLFAVIMGLIGLAAHKQCATQASKMELPYSWGFFQQCMIEVDGKWISIDAYKVVRVRP